MAALVLLAGCGTNAVQPTPSPTASSKHCLSPISSTPITASAASHRVLTLVTLNGSDQIVVRDITDINHPATVATSGLSPDMSPTFVTATELAAINSKGIVRMPVSGSARDQTVRPCPVGDVVAYGWSRDARLLTYVVEVPDTSNAPLPSHFDWHLAVDGFDRRIGTAPAWCHCDGEHGADRFDFRVALSPNGRYVSLVENVPGGTDFQVRRTDGTLVSEIKPSDPSDAITMGVWSGEVLYFRDSKGVEAWKDGTIKLFLPGVDWVGPKASPAGGEIAYLTRGSDGAGHVYVVATATGRVAQIGPTLRFDPVFLSSRYVWYEGERPCTPADQCQVETTVPSGSTYIYDRQRGAESQSAITAVYDVWPHGS